MVPIRNKTTTKLVQLLLSDDAPTWIGYRCASATTNQTNATVATYVMERPIMNPQNPYVGTLRLFPGTMVKVYCQPRPNASRFAINFQLGPSLNPRDDLALHLSPCFNPPRLVRNSLQHGQWGLEEAWGNGSVMAPNQAYEFIILVEPSQFKIAVNGAHYCEFKHRIPFEHVSHLTIDGDVDIERIAISSSSQQIGTAYQPTAPPTAPNPSTASNTPYPPYPIGGATMPMPGASIYPPLSSNSDGRPGAGMYPSMPAAAPPYAMPSPGGPMPSPAGYSSGPPMPAQPPYGQHSYPQGPAGPYPAPPTGPMPAPGSYQSGYPVSGDGDESWLSSIGRKLFG